jgi:hypothetical protein
MFLGIDQMREHVIFHDLGHEPRHGAACAGDEVHDLLAPCLIRESAFDALNLSSQAANTRQQLFLIANRVAHAGYYGIPTYPILVGLPVTSLAFTGSSRLTRQLGQRWTFWLPHMTPIAAPSGREHRGQGIVIDLSTNQASTTHNTR